MFEIITTIGPSSDNISTLHSLKNAGASSFRINLSHMNKSTLLTYLNLFRDASILPSLDTQGAQLRTNVVTKQDYLDIGDNIYFATSTLAHDDQDIYFSINQPSLDNQLSVGDILKIDFDGLSLKVTDKNPSSDVFKAQVLSGGFIKPNKAIDIIDKTLILQPLTDLDIFALSYIKEFAVPEIFMSFCNSSADIDVLRSHLHSYVGCDMPRIIAKIETKNAILNISDICNSADAILVDRGDLSRELSITSIPKVVKQVIKLASSLNTPVLIATNVLDSMLSGPMPSRAEVSDIYSLIDYGVSGLVLAAEVAIGKYPVDSVRVIKYLSQYYHAESFGLSTDGLNRSLPQRFQYWL